jgi:hypothetical protein
MARHMFAQTREGLIEQLREFDRQANTLRQRLGIHPPEQEIYLTQAGGNTITVKADGYGGATLTIYDDLRHHRVVEETEFRTEEAACNAASKKDEELS